MLVCVVARLLGRSRRGEYGGWLRSIAEVFSDGMIGQKIGKWPSILNGWISIWLVLLLRQISSAHVKFLAMLLVRFFLVMNCEDGVSNSSGKVKRCYVFSKAGIQYM